MTEKRWKSNKNITGNPYIYDSENERQYWVDDELYLITCILNKYEDELHTLLGKFRYSEIPTTWSEIINSIVNNFKKELMFKDRRELKKYGGWELKQMEEIDGIKYIVTLKIMQE